MNFYSGQKQSVTGNSVSVLQPSNAINSIFICMMSHSTTQEHFMNELKGNAHGDNVHVEIEYSNYIYIISHTINNVGTFLDE